jgi:hypothetical protein
LDNHGTSCPCRSHERRTLRAWRGYPNPFLTCPQTKVKRTRLGHQVIHRRGFSAWGSNLLSSSAVMMFSKAGVWLAPSVYSRQCDCPCAIRSARHGHCADGREGTAGQPVVSSARRIDRNGIKRQTCRDSLVGTKTSGLPSSRTSTDKSASVSAFGQSLQWSRSRLRWGASYMSDGSGSASWANLYAAELSAPRSNAKSYGATLYLLVTGYLSAYA